MRTNEHTANAYLAQRVTRVSDERQRFSDIKPAPQRARSTRPSMVSRALSFVMGATS